jgi:DNA repair exonuclease SbcCD ATPase subunit
MPLSAQELPLTRNLRREILEHVEARLAELAASASVDGLQESVNALQSQVESLPDIRAELAMTSPLTAVQKLEADLDEVRAMIQPREELQPEQILALLPQSPEGWPVAQAMRQEIIEHVETRVAGLASNASVDGLQESVNALQSQVESIPDIRAELAKIPPLSAVQKLETDLEELRTLVRDQADAMDALRQTLTERDAALAELKAGEARLREELASVAAQADSAPAMDAVKNELREYIRQQVPLAAAKVIREEIQTLLKELGG